jgi:alkylation response protein AidB-like acyl-CoA dehydrogenase
MFCGLNVLRKGSEEQKRTWLPRLMAGEVKMSISISEPDAGSDAGAMRTRARRDGEHWVIDGQKLWATGAGAKGNVICLYAKTDTQVNYRQGMSLFLVDNEAPGVRLRKLDMLGRRSVGTYEIFFDDVRVTADRLVGGEHKGWECLLSGLQLERICTTAGYCGAMQAVLDLAVGYAQERKQFGKPIGSFQAIAHLLADTATELEAARTLMWRAAWLASTGANALREISIAKLFASEAYVRAANTGMQVLGAYGYNMEFDMQRHFRDSRAATIAAGSSQLQRNLIAGLMGLKVS